MTSGFKFSLLAAVAALVSSPLALAVDARSLALGGSAIAAGQGVHGVLENPSTLKRLQRDGERVHLHLGVTADVRDPGDLAGDLTDGDNEDLATDIENEIDRLSGQSITCENPLTPDRSQVCLSGTSMLGQLGSDVLGVFDDINGDEVTGRVTGDFGLAITMTPIPFAAHIQVSVTGSGAPEIAQSDRDYINEFVETLSDGDVTLQEIDDSSSLDIDLANQTFQIQQPEDAVNSTVEATAVMRTQFGLSLAHSLELANFNLDLGVTPKFSSVEVGSLDALVSDTFDEQTESYQDQFEDNQDSSSTFTADIGATAYFSFTPIRAAAVLRNAIPETVESATGVKFETTPQLIVGGAMDVGIALLTADVALNKAKNDNFETQPMSIGAEVGTSLLAFRAGISIDNARDDDKAALALGVQLGPLQLGGRIAEFGAAHFAAQLAFSF